jgi:acyl-CoA synthetase (AMP-forming)/AMP-acid ligase II
MIASPILGARIDPSDGLRRYDIEAPANLVDMLNCTVTRCGQQPAFIDGEGFVTWAEFSAIVESTARGLAAEGVAPGERVALLAGNGIPLTAAYWALWCLGAIAVPLNHRLTAADLVTQLQDSGSRILLVGKGKNELGSDAARDSGTAPFFQGEDEYFFSSRPGSDFTPAPLSATTPAAIMYTSGTTGRAKGVVISHENAVQNSVTCTEIIGRRGDDVELIMVPQFNVTGLCSQTIPVVHLGMTAVLLDGFNASKVVDLIKRCSVTSTVGAPTMWWRILESTGTDELPSLRLALYGGAPMPVALLDQMRSVLTSASFGNGYGMTETCSMVSYLGGEEALLHPDSVGRPLPITELRLLPPDEDREVASGEVGEVTVRGPQVALGYWTNQGISQVSDANGWLRTGDAAKLIDGFVVLADRLKDVIKRGGESIFSIEVEEALYQHPSVLEAAVVGIPDEIFGELVLAVVVTKPDMNITAEEIQRHCRALVAPFKVPNFVEFRDELPRNAGGKALKALLKVEFNRPKTSVG